MAPAVTSEFEEKYRCLCGIRLPSAVKWLAIGKLTLHAIGAAVMLIVLAVVSSKITNDPSAPVNFTSINFTSARGFNNLTAAEEVALVHFFLLAGVVLLAPVLITYFITTVAVLIAVLFAVKRQSRYLLLPYLIFNSLVILVLIPKSVIAVLFTLTDGGLTNTTEVFGTLALVLYAAFECWMWYLVYKCFIYFRDMQMSYDNTNYSAA